MSNKIGTLTIDRGDRPQFLEFCKQQLNNQTLQPDVKLIFDEKPKSSLPDLTYRYRKGFEKLFNEGCEVVFCIENDDAYSNKYIETMYNAWLKHGKPDIIGINSTIYYHIFSQKHSELEHKGHSSMMSTGFTKAVLDVQWPSDDHIFLDLWLWRRMKGVLLTIKEPICVGIKHDIGLCGGKAHDPNWGKLQDNNFSYLSTKIDSESLEFYKNVR